MHDLPEHQDDQGLWAIPSDVLKLSFHQSINGNTNWSRPSGTDVNRSITNLQLKYFQNYDRVTIINNLSLIFLDMGISKFSRYPCIKPYFNLVLISFQTLVG